MQHSYLKKFKIKFLSALNGLKSVKAFSIDFADFKFLNETAVASDALFLLNLIQVTESISGSVLPLAMFGLVAGLDLVHCCTQSHC